MTGFGVAFGLAWRRSRAFYLWWLLGLVWLMPLTVQQYDQIVWSGPHPEIMLNLLADNPTMRALLGPPFDVLSPGGFTFWRVGIFVAVGAAMMAGLGVVRATRADEEAGRCELIRAGALARHAPLAAGLVLALLACATLALLVAVSMVALGEAVPGSVAAGLGIGLTGAVYAGVAAVLGQVFESARTVRAWTLGIFLGGSFLARALIDGMGAQSFVQPLQWAVPLQWAALVRPYAGERWEVLVLPAGLTLVLAGLALLLEDRRDHGAGLMPARGGPATAGPWMSGGLGLAWRLQRLGIGGWLAGLGVSALGLGYLAGMMEQVLAENPRFVEMMRLLGGGSQQFREAYLISMRGLMAVVAAIFAAQLLSRARLEESQGRLELLLSTALPRTRFLGGHVVLSLMASGIGFLGVGVLLALPEALRSGRISEIWDSLAAVGVLYAGVALIVGLVTSLIGWAPRWMPVAWLVLCWSVVAVWIGPLFSLPGWLVEMSPWGYLPQLPGEEMSWPPVLIQTLAALGLILLGWAGYRWRDIPDS